MSKSKKNLNRAPRRNGGPSMSELDDILRRCVVVGDVEEESIPEELEEYIHEYNDSFAVPGEYEIPRRKNYPTRELGEIQDLLGREYDALTELINHVVNDTEISPSNELINLDRTEVLKDYRKISQLHDTINRLLDYSDVLEAYAENLKDGLLNLPDELNREKALLIFSFQDLLGNFINLDGEKSEYHGIIEDNLINTIRQLADGKISGDEAKRIARELEIKLEGFTRLNENVSDNKYFKPALDLEDSGYPGGDERTM